MHRIRGTVEVQNKWSRGVFTGFTDDWREVGYRCVGKRKGSVLRNPLLLRGSELPGRIENHQGEGIQEFSESTKMTNY